MNGGTWAQWQTVAVTGIVVILVYAATVGVGAALADLVGLSGFLGAFAGLLAGLAAGYVLASRLLHWVLRHTVLRED